MSRKNFERRVGNLENRVGVIETKIDMFMEEMRVQTNEIKSELSNVNNHVQVLTVTAVGGMVATIIGVAAMAYAIITK